MSITFVAFFTERNKREKKCKEKKIEELYIAISQLVE